MANASSLVPLEYVGKKPYKTDNINHTRTVWKAQGDIQLYPENLAPALESHPDIWRRAAGSPPAEAPMREEPEPQLSARQAATKRDTERGPSLHEDSKAGPDPARKPGTRTLE